MGNLFELFELLDIESIERLVFFCFWKEIIVISKTPVLEMKDIVQTVIYNCDFHFAPMDLNYFGTEFMQDLKRNEQILNKKV